MPIWAEVVVLCMATYAAGLGVGWVLWGRELANLDRDTTDA